MESYSALRGDLNRLNLALYFVWLVEQISPLGVPNVKVFNLLVRSLEKLASGNLKNDLCETFEKSLAIFEGVAPPAFPKIISLKKYFEEYLDRIYPAYFGEVENIAP
jgi:recombinational DNA repair protein (RecF pathway)